MNVHLTVDQPESYTVRLWLKRCDQLMQGSSWQSAWSVSVNSTQPYGALLQLPQGMTIFCLCPSSPSPLFSSLLLCRSSVRPTRCSPPRVRCLPPSTTP